MEESYLERFLVELRDLPEFSNVDQISLNTKSLFGDTPLHVAATRGDTQAIQALLNSGADVNAQGEDQYTPLHEAVAQGHVEAVRLLIAANARKDLKNEHGDTPLHLAELLGRVEISKILR